ncbi:DUF2079 domain-containing protein [Candidatus Ozemobacteraceae bacterium]|nr:DUF2079 domain-containing protein [Candidatus Ozemobacteraceae bacterium]
MIYFADMGKSPPVAFLLALFLLAIAVSGFGWHVTKNRWANWDIGIDTAMWSQAFHQAQQGDGFRFTCYADHAGGRKTESRSYLSMHFTLTLWPLSWLFNLVPHPLILFAVLHLAFGLGTILIGLLAYSTLGREPWTAFALALGFALYPPNLLSQTTYDFNPRHLALVFLPLAGLAQAWKSDAFFIGALVLLSIGEENLAILSAFALFGRAVLEPERRRLFSMAGVLFVLYAVIVLKTVMPAFLAPGWEIHFQARYRYILESPLQAVFRLFGADQVRYLVWLVFPLLLTPLFAANAWLAATLPFLAQNLLSPFEDTRMIGHHYTTPLAVCLFLAGMANLAGLEERLRRRLAILLATSCLALCLTVFPSLSWLWEGADPRVEELGANLAPLERLIPENVSLSAPPAVCAQFWKRRQLWYFPQGSDIAEWVVFPRYSIGYPSISAIELESRLHGILRGGRHTLVLENPDILVFQKHSVP